MKAETWTYNGATDDWANSTFWSDNLAGAPVPPGMDGQTYTNVRLDISRPVTYGAAQGNQIYDVSPAMGETRALRIFDGGSLTLTGGTLTLVQDAGTTVANLAEAGGTASLNLSGGNLVINEASNGGTLAVTWNGGTGTVNIGNGSTLTADRISFGQANSTTGAGTGTLNLNAGGTLEVRTIRENSSGATSLATINFDGGTLKVRGAENNGFALIDGSSGGGIDAAFILGGGLTVDTNNFTARISEALLDGDQENGGLTKNGDGILVMQANGSTYTGATTVNAGTLQIGNNTATGAIGLGNLVVASGATLAIKRSDAVIQSQFDGSGIKTGYSGPGHFQHTGTGLLTLDVANTHTGTTTVASNSHLRITHAGALGSTTSGTIVNGTGGDGESDGSGGSLELVGGTNGLVVSGEALTIRGSGGQSLDGGAQQRGALQAVSGNAEWAGTVNIAGTNTRIGIQDGANLTISGTITDSGAGHRVIFRGGTTTAGNITLSGAGNSWSETLVFGSSLRIGGNNVLPITAPLLVGTGGVGASTFDLNGFNQQVRGLSQTSDNTEGVVTNRGASDSVLTMSGTSEIDGSRTFRGRLTNGATNKLAVVKSGTYEQILAGANTYTGDTTVSAGALVVTGSITGSTINVNGGSLGGNGTIVPSAGKSLNLLANGALRPGVTAPGTLNVNLAGGGSFHIGTGVAAAATHSLAFDLGSTSNSDKIAVTGGALNIGTGVLAFDDFAFTPLTGFGEGTYTLFSGDTAIVGSLALANLTGTIGAFTGTLGLDGANVVLTVIPEPSTAVAILAGTAMLAGFRRRQRFAGASR